MATAGYDYVLSGFKWTAPARITYSFPPDGVLWQSGTNVLNATFDAKFGGDWKREIARALATWQSVANINIAPTTDGRYDWNSLGQAQGDPKFGDIRIGGYGFNGNDKTLAQAYFPPPQGATAGGDVQINTNMSFQIGAPYDLYSVVLHETGHSLGLNHSVSTTSVMAATYAGIRTGLTEGDIAGIQAIYGARNLDAYQSRGVGLSATLPIDLTAGLTSASMTTINGASLTKIGDVEWFSFVAPSNASGTWSVLVGAAGVSMLSPEVSVYDASMNLLARAGNPLAWSNDVTVAVSTITPGQRYYVSVKGADNGVFSVGSYNLRVAVSKAAPPPPPTPTPPPPPPPTPTPTPNPPPNPVFPTTPVVVNPSPGVNANAPGALPDRFESNDVIGAATRLGRINQIALPGLTLHSAADVDYFAFQNAAAGTFQIAASGVAIQVLSPRGALVAQGVGSVNVTIPKNATVYIRVASANSAPVAQYGLSIATQPQIRQAAPPRAPLPRPPFPRAPLPPWVVLPRLARLVAAPSPMAERLVRQEAAPTAAFGGPRLPASWTNRMRAVATD